MTKPESLATLASRDPLAPARIRAIKAKRALLATEGGTVRAAEVSQLLGITRQGVDKRRTSGLLLALSAGQRGYRYPLWQFGADGTIAGLERVLQALKDCDPWTQVHFMLTGDARLGGQRPLDVLREGRADEVARAAAAFCEFGGQGA